MLGGRALFLIALTATLTCCLSLPASHAQTGGSGVATTNELYRQKINANTVTIIGGSMTGTYLRIADDIARGVGDGDNLRILPIRGGGTAKNVRDILYLRGIDMGMVRADVIETFRGKKHFENIQNRLHYISRLHFDEFHLISSNPNIKSIFDLQGKTVAFHGGGEVSGLLLLNSLGITIGKVVKATIFSAAAKTKTGEYHAMMRITGKSFGGVNRLLKIDPNLRLIPIPYHENLAKTPYAPTTLSHADYPQLIEKGKTIDTVAVSAVLGVFNWKPGTDRYRRIVKFVNAYFSKFDKIVSRKGRHKKWDDIDIYVDVKGWTRFPPAADWLRKQAELRKNAPRVSRRQLEQKFKRFLITSYGEGRTLPDGMSVDQLFSEFRKWLATRRE